jgi:hypothetical protein
MLLWYSKKKPWSMSASNLLKSMRRKQLISSAQIVSAGAPLQLRQWYPEKFENAQTRC